MLKTGLPRYVFAVVLMVLMGLPATAGPNCTCRYKGSNYEIGQVQCILGKLRRCEMALNNSSWKVLSDMCPYARLKPAAPAAPMTLAASMPTGR